MLLTIFMWPVVNRSNVYIYIYHHMSLYRVEVKFSHKVQAIFWLINKMTHTEWVKLLNVKPRKIGGPSWMAFNTNTYSHFSHEQTSLSDGLLDFMSKNFKNFSFTSGQLLPVIWWSSSVVFKPFGTKLPNDNVTVKEFCYIINYTQ